MGYVYKVKVNEERVNKIQALQYDLEAKQEVIKNIIGMNDPSVLEGASFKKYNEDMIAVKKEYEMERATLQASCIPDELSKNHSVNWSLDYLTNEFTVMVNCDCGAELAKKLELPTEVN